MSEEEKVKKIIEGAKNQIKLENRTGVLEDGRKLRAEDLKTSQDPEEFTKRHIIEKVFQILNVHFETGEARFTVPSGTRKVDYAPKTDDTNFLVEAKPINSDLFDKSKDGAVNQIKGLFLLDDVKKRYGFGVATDGLKWIIINPRQEIIAELSLEKDFKAISSFLTGKREAKKERRQEEISKRFFQWYNALLHGGTFKDLKNKTRKISPEGCLVSNIRNVESKEDSEEIAQTLIDRLIFIKFIQVKGLIKFDILEYLSKLEQELLNLKLSMLFFNVLNTEVEKRPSIDTKFKEIPYLNGSLFTKTEVELNNPDYNIKAEILISVIEFLDAFRFVSENEEVEDALDPEILGYIFERAMTATDRKGTGAYYTPKYITRYIGENTIYPFILGRARGFLKDEKGYRDSELPGTFDDLIEKVSATSLSEIYVKVVQNVKVLDPACGSGAFLLSAANVLLESYNRFEQRIGLNNSHLALKKVILKNNIHGVDINHEGIEIAKLRLWLWMAESYNPEGKIEPLPNIEYNIMAGNSLVGYVDLSRFKEAKISLDDYLETEETLQHLLTRRDGLIREYRTAYGDSAKKLKKEIEELNGKAKRKLDIRLFQDLAAKVEITSTEFMKLEPFHWGFEFHDIFSNGSGFDVVIGNPPYVRQEALGDFKKILKEYYEVYHGVADLYTYFFERGHKILRENGQFGFISSNKFMRSNYGKGLRRFLKNDSKIHEIVDFGELPVFEGAATFPAILLTERRRNAIQTIKFTQVKTLEFISLQEEVKRLGTTIKDNAISGTNWTLVGGLEAVVLEKIQNLATPLGNYLDGDIKYGIKTGFNKAFIIDIHTRNKLIAKDPKSSEIIKPFIVVDDIRKYEINFHNKYIIWTHIGVPIDNYPAIFKHLKQFQKQLEKRWDQGNYWWELRACDYYDKFEQPKIIYPIIGKEPRFTFDSKNYFSGDTTFIIPRKDFYLLALLNSSLIYNVFQNLSSTLGDVKKGGRIQLKPVYYINFPIVRSISFTTPEDERTRRVGELEDFYEKGDVEKILELVESYLPKDSDGNFILEQEKSDVVHDILAYLAEQMIEMNKEKQSEIKGFHNWLEDYTHLKIDDMTLKSKAKEYYKLKWSEMQKIIQRNKAKITELDITRSEPQEKIKEEFDSSTGKLKPLLDRIKETDRLIDQIVYTLYGLTEEEIKVVEGSE